MGSLRDMVGVRGWKL